MIYLEDGSVVPVEKSELTHRTSRRHRFNSPGNPLDKHPTWKYTISTNLLVKKLYEKLIHWIHLLTLLGIFLRFCSPKYKDAPFDEKTSEFMDAG